MVSLELHPRGIAVVPEPGARVSELGTRLRRRIGESEVLSLRGRFIVPASAAESVLDEFRQDEVHCTQEVERLISATRQQQAAAAAARIGVEQALRDPLAALADYQGVGRLDPHQVEAVAAMTVPSLVGLALFDEQGTGKTIMALAAYDCLRKRGNLMRLLVVAPKSVIPAWKADAAKLLGASYDVVAVGGSAATRRLQIQSPCDIMLISYDCLVRDSRLIETVAAGSPRPFVLVADESYFVKNELTNRSRAIARLRQHCARAFVLCGTPAPNSARDVVNQINLADMGATFGDRPIPDEEAAAQAAIRAGLATAVVLRRLKEDVLPFLPSKEFERVYVQLRPVQRAMYDKAVNELVVAVRDASDQEFARRLTSFLAQRAALLQICAHPGSLDPLYGEEPAKLVALDQLVGDVVLTQREKLVIWSFFRFDLDAIAERYNKLGLVRIDGSVQSLRDRADAIDRFQHDPQVRIFLGNAAAAGAGITLTSARHVAYESFSNQAAHYMQSLDRVHRRGQDRPVTYHVILAKDTVDEIEFERLIKKEHSARDLLGDHSSEPITRERFLADLGADGLPLVPAAPTE